MATPDSVLQRINREFVSLNRDDTVYVDAHYRKVLEKLITIMKCKDGLFNDIYKDIYFAGSYYDDLKICKPEEFDVDIVLELPIDYSEMSFKSRKVTPGFLKVRASEIDELLQDTRTRKIYSHMREWTDNEGFLRHPEFRKWMVGVVDKALDCLPKQRNNAQLNIEGQIYQILCRSSGPAITLHVTLPDNQTYFEVDLVPVLEFKYPKWPPQTRRNPFPEIESWFIVPKNNSKNPAEMRDTFWRLAFHGQERAMIKDKGQLKPACRLIKKLRDRHGLHNICSYYIKTVFLWMVEQHDVSDSTYWKTTSLSELFLEALVTLSLSLKDAKLRNYWNVENNLLAGSGMSKTEQENVSISLNKIIGDIEKNMHKTPSVFAKHLLTPEELERFNNDGKADQINAVQVQIKSNTDVTVLSLKNELEQLKKTVKKYVKVVAGLEKLVSELKEENEELQDSIERQQNGLGFLFRKARDNSWFW